MNEAEIVMDWLSSNWVWILAIAFFVGMHLFGHGSHGGGHSHAGRASGGGCGGGKRRDRASSDDTNGKDGKA